MERTLLLEDATNGGFPEPPASVPARVVAAHHAACGEATRVRLPSALPAGAVRRLRCAGCAQDFDAELIEELEIEELEAAVPELTEAAPVEVETEREAVADPQPEVADSPRRPRIRKPALPKLSIPTPKLARPKLPKLNPESRTWRLASIPIAAVLVIGGLLLLQGDGDEPNPTASPAEESAGGDATAVAPPAGEIGGGAAGGGGSAGAGGGASNASNKTEFVRGSSYSLALPAGWKRVNPSGGATFAAVATDGGADATLWIEEDPKLEFPAFITQSLAQLESLAGSARVVERIPAPTPEDTTVVLAAEAPPGQPTYEVTLRVAGPYRYYLATSVQPDASPEAVQGAELVAGSFTPEVKG